MRKIYDCFRFYNELDVLEIRLNELYNYVDLFFILEGELTHQGEPKPLFYKENIERFKPYQDKIVYVFQSEAQFVGKDESRATRAWSNERHSFDVLRDALLSTDGISDEDLVIMDNVDEVPSSYFVQQLKEKYIKPMYIKSDILCYYLNTQFGHDSPRDNAHGHIEWACGPVLTIKDVRAAKNGYEVFTMRHSFDCSNIHIDNDQPHGWHFTYMGDAEYIWNKFHAFAHSEFNHLSVEEVQSYRDKLFDPCGRPLVDPDGPRFEFYGMYPIENLPKIVQTNPDKFKHILKQ